jgi:hypothetical protein
MSDTKSLTDFFAAWGETDADDRAALVASVVGDSIYYADPHAPAPITSAAELAAFIGMFSEKSPPGARAEVIEPVDFHHGHARANVRFIMSEEMQMVGQYFADLDAAGKITRLVGFPGKGAE